MGKIESCISGTQGRWHRVRFFLVALLISICALSQVTAAGTSKNKSKDKELFDQGAELSYEGQLKMAEKLAGQEKTPAATPEDDWSGSSLFLAMIWGAIGTGYFIYGKKQSKYVFLMCGIGLMAFPYFISNLIAGIVIGLAMIIIPFKVEI